MLPIALIALFAIVMTRAIIVSLSNVAVTPMMYYIECTLGIFILILVILMASTSIEKHDTEAKVIFHIRRYMKRPGFGMASFSTWHKRMLSLELPTFEEAQLFI